MTIHDIEKHYDLRGATKVVYSPCVRTLCIAPYYGHPKGCPNFGKKPDCPPKAPLFLDLYTKVVFVISVRFDFAGYIMMRSIEHPDWSDRMLRNPLYWQGHVNKHLRKYVFGTIKQTAFRHLKAVFNPEGMGIDVTSTCDSVGIKLEWPPEKYVHKVALLAKPK